MIMIDYHSRVPIYEQIKEQIILLINTGVYQVDEQLPSIRALSREININVNTIKRAFSELESDGVVYCVPGRGVFVAPHDDGHERVIAAALADIGVVLQSAKAKGVPSEKALALLKEIYEGDEGND